ncbi:MAG: TIGR02281 family clan AA aspartic protease [Parvibaculum sp.]|nr:TIGR02281 family clan AA aspartic protease [Parvibaculum sp.]
MRQNSWTWAALVLLGLLALVFLLDAQFPDALGDENGRMRLVYGLIWLTVIGASVIMGWRHNAGLALKQALAWIAIFMLFVVIYSVKDDLMNVGGDLGTRVASSLATAKPVTAGDGTVYLTRRMEGAHFHVDAVVNGHVTSFLIDTGASDVALTLSAARGVGIDVNKLTFNQPYQTANGVTMGARVMLDSIQVGGITVRNVRGSVMKEDGVSLLGMSFLNALGSYEFKGDRLVLRK